MDVGLLLLRVVIGLTLTAHGARKLFGWFGGPGLDALAKGMEMLGFHPGLRHAWMAGLVELVGGLLLFLGLATPIGAALASAVMLVAAVTAHVKNGFFIIGGGFEYNLVLGVSALSPAFTGPGALSLDALVGYSHGGLYWGMGALVLAGPGAGILLAQRRQRGVKPTANAAG